MTSLVENISAIAALELFLVSEYSRELKSDKYLHRRGDSSHAHRAQPRLLFAKKYCIIRLTSLASAISTTHQVPRKQVRTKGVATVLDRMPQWNGFRSKSEPDRTLRSTVCLHIHAAGHRRCLSARLRHMPGNHWHYARYGLERMESLSGG